MTRKPLRLALWLSLSIGLTACDRYDGWVRYPCQEFENWQKAECNPPECVSTGVCTQDIFGDEIVTQDKS